MSMQVDPQSRPVTPFNPAPPDTAAVRELLSTMSQTMQALGQTFDTLSEQSTRVATLGPMIDSAHQIHHLRRQMRAQEKKQDQRINSVKNLLKNILKEQVADSLRTQIQDQISIEVKYQVAEQVKKQLKEQLPADLKEQAEESSAQLMQVRSSLMNSEARRRNAALRASNLDDPLLVIVKPDGTESDLFPTDLRTLFSYDDETARDLVRDFGLPESDTREKNLNKFMAHAGIQFHLLPIPVASDL
ncbi:hypothetical protein FRC03_010594 [Tulasnella sp. 419]|nr:hypothetical protein FRC02_003172 [Tulasnella sp. 418]KAG8957040.1 hypothetical protein FRC03_010594 [Tulasnella sp. 419]